MRRYISLLLVIIMVFSLVGCGSKNEPGTEENLQRFNIYLDLECEQNIFFATYDVELYLDDVRVGLMPHGEHYTHLIEDTLEGSHKLYFYKDGDHSVKNYISVNLQCDSTVIATVHTNKNDIEVKGVNAVSGISGNSLKIPNVTGKVLEEAMNELKQIGFTNIHYSDEIWDRNNWTVIEQSVSADEIADKNIRIDLTCKKRESISQSTDGKENQTSKDEEKLSSNNVKKSTKYDARKAAASGIYAYKNGGKYADFYLYIDMNNDTIRSLSTDSTEVLVGTLAGSLETCLRACYEKNVWYEDMFIRDNDYSSMYCVNNEDNAIVRYSRVEPFEVEEYLHKAGYKDYYEESGRAKNVTDCQVDDAIIESIVKEIKDEYGKEFLTYSYDIVNNEYRFLFSVALMSTYNANLTKYKDLFYTEARKYNDLTKNLYDRLNKNTKNEVHVSAYIYSVGMGSGFDACQYRSLDGKSADTFNW